MTRLLEELEERIYQLKQVIKAKKRDLLIAPKGSVHVAVADSRVQFYKQENQERKYLKESESQLVDRLCQKDYDTKVLKSEEQELKRLEKLHKNYKENSYEQVYPKLHIERKKRVKSEELPDDEFIKQWEAYEYPKKEFLENVPEYYTDKGERVRSKTEILIANALNKHNIPYRYETLLRLEGYGIVHPDFTILNVRLRKEIYLEHMGMMDDSGYIEYALGKILAYEKNGYFPGDKLVLTHETSKVPLNFKLLEKVIEQYFI